jgi:hypothetical protein
VSGWLFAGEDGFVDDLAVDFLLVDFLVDCEPGFGDGGGGGVPGGGGGEFTSTVRYLDTEAVELPLTLLHDNL